MPVTFSRKYRPRIGPETIVFELIVAPDELPDCPVVVKLTEAERKRLGHAAIEGNTTQQYLIRKALRAAGLI